MKFTGNQIALILLGNIQNQTHRRERLVGFFKFLVSRVWRVLPTLIPAERSDKKAMLLFSTEKFFRLDVLRDFQIYCYKEKLPATSPLDLRHEEYILILSIFLPDFARKLLFTYVYRRLAKRLSFIEVTCFVCNQPEIINHLIALYCRSRGVVTITMQHGIYMPEFYQPLYYERHLADIIFVWGEVYRSCYQRHSIGRDHLVVSSPPLLLGERPEKRRSPAEMRPVFLGQQLFKIHNGVFEPYNKFLSQLIKYWAQFGVKLSYKPHPREDLSKSLSNEIAPELRIESRASVSINFFDRFDVAYSVNSTSLFHALCADALCFQADMALSDLPNEWFDKHSTIVRISADQINGHLALPAASKPRFIDPSFLHLTSDPQKFNSELLLRSIQ